MSNKTIIGFGFRIKANASRPRFVLSASAFGFGLDNFRYHTPHPIIKNYIGQKNTIKIATLSYRCRFLLKKNQTNKSIKIANNVICVNNCLYVFWNFSDCVCPVGEEKVRKAKTITALNYTKTVDLFQTELVGGDYI